MTDQWAAFRSEQPPTPPGPPTADEWAAFRGGDSSASQSDLPPGFEPVPQSNGLAPGFEPVEQAPANVAQSTGGLAPGFEPLPAGFEPVPQSAYRPIDPSPPSFLDRLVRGAHIMERMGKIWSAGKEGFGDQPLGMTSSPAVNRILDATAGLPYSPKSAIEAYDLLTRSLNAGFHGLGEIAAQTAGAFGESQGWQERAREDVENFGNWLMTEGGMRGTMGDAVRHAPLVDAGDGKLARITMRPDGTIEPQVIGTYPPTPADFDNAARAVVRAQDQFSNLEGHVASRVLGERIETENAKQARAAQTGSGTTFPPANDEKAIGHIASKLHDLWEEQGLHPAEVADRVKDAPVMAHDLSAARSPELPLPEKPSPQFVKEMDDKFFRLRKSATADKEEFLQHLERLPETVKDPETQELWYKYMEGDPTVTMPPELGKLYNEVMAPLKREEADLWETAKRTDLDVDDLNPNYAHRIVVGKHPGIDRLAGEGQEENPIYNGPGLLKRTASSMEGRKYFALQDQAGDRQLVAITKDGDLVSVAKGKPSQTIEEKFTDTKGPVVGRTVVAADRTWRVTHALTREIEDATNVRYYKNALANTIDNILHLRAANRAIYTVQQLRDTPEWEKYTARRGTAGVPRDWKTPQLSLFTNDVMHPYLAELADDFYGTRDRDGLSDALRRLNRFSVGSLFWTPIPHIANAGSHWVLERSWDWIKPTGWKSLAVDGAKAIRSVATQDKTYQRMLRDGSGLIYGDLATRDFYRNMMRETGMRLKDDPEWASIAGITRLRPDRLLSAMYNASSRALWAVSDMFMVQRLLELERKGLQSREAIDAAERHMPNYRLPPRIMGSRSLRRAFGNPFLFNFSRYHYGVLKGYANLAKELMSGDPEEMAHATGAIMAFGVLQLAVWPALSALLQKVTGDKSFSVPSFGPGRLARPIIGSVVAHTPNVWPDWVKDYYKDNPDFLQQLSNMVVFSPVFNYGLEEYENRYNFTGRPITEPADWRHAWESLMDGQPNAHVWGNVARTQGEHVARALWQPYNTVDQAWRKGLDPSTALIQGMFGVQYHTEQQEAAKARAFRYQDREALRRQRRPIGLIESLGQ